MSRQRGNHPCCKLRFHDFGEYQWSGSKSSGLGAKGIHGRDAREGKVRRELPRKCIQELKCKSQNASESSNRWTGANVSQEFGKIMPLIGQIKIFYWLRNSCIQMCGSRCQASSSWLLLLCTWKKLQIGGFYYILTAMQYWSGQYA